MALGPCLFWICRLSKNKKYAAYDRFHVNGPYGEVPTKKEPIRTPGFPLRLPCHLMFLFIFRRSWRGPITLESQLSQPYIGWCDRGGTGREPEQESKKQQRASDSNHLLTSLPPGKRFQSKREAWEVPRSVSGEVCRWKKNQNIINTMDFIWICF